MHSNSYYQGELLLVISHHGMMDVLFTLLPLAVWSPDLLSLDQLRRTEISVSNSMYPNVIWLWGCRLPLASLGRTRLPPLSLTLVEDVISSFWSSSSAFSSSVRDIRISDLVVVQMKTVDTEVEELLWSTGNTLFFLNFCTSMLRTLPFFPALFPHKLFPQVAPI